MVNQSKGLVGWRVKAFSIIFHCVAPICPRCYLINYACPSSWILSLEEQTVPSRPTTNKQDKHGCDCKPNQLPANYCITKIYKHAILLRGATCAKPRETRSPFARRSSCSCTLGDVMRLTLLRCSMTSWNSEELAAGWRIY